jgi:hypothetical protein
MPGRRPSPDGRAPRLENGMTRRTVANFGPARCAEVLYRDTGGAGAVGAVEIGCPRPATHIWVYWTMANGRPLRGASAYCSVGRKDFPEQVATDMLKETGHRPEWIPII